MMDKHEVALMEYVKLLNKRYINTDTNGKELVDFHKEYLQVFFDKVVDKEKHPGLLSYEIQVDKENFGYTELSLKLDKIESLDSLIDILKYLQQDVQKYLRLTVQFSY